MAIGTTEWWIIGAVVILLFGAGAFGKWMKAIAESRKAFKDTVDKDIPK